MIPTLYLGQKDHPDNFATQGCLAEALANIDSNSLFKGNSLPEQPTNTNQTQYEMALINYCDVYFWCDGIGWLKHTGGNSSSCPELSEFPNHSGNSSFVYIDGTGTAACGLYKKSIRGWLKI